MPTSRLWAAAAAAVILFCTPAAAHDIYTGLHSGFDNDHQQTFRLREVGQLCCNGEGKDADCEPVPSGYRVLPDGDYAIWSERYHKRVVISPSKVTWSGVAGSDEEVNWCGTPREHVSYPGGFPVVDDNHDPVIWTYCIFIVPGGM